MRKLETLQGLNITSRHLLGGEQPMVADKPNIPVVQPKDIFIKKRSTDLPLFPENLHLTRFELRLMKDAGHIAIEEDYSMETPSIAMFGEETTIFDVSVLEKAS